MTWNYVSCDKKYPGFCILSVFSLIQNFECRIVWQVEDERFCKMTH